MIEKKYFAFALLGHLVIFISMLNWVPAFLNPVVTSYHDINSINVTLADPPVPFHKKSSTDLLKKAVMIPTKKKVIVFNNLKRKTQRPQTRTAQQKTKKHHDTNQLFLKILHAAIAEKQSYPESAINNHKGTVAIRFLIKPNGQFSQFSIQKSSGYGDLDSAALAALKMVAPLKEAKEFLTKEAYFSIDIVFA